MSFKIYVGNYPAKFSEKDVENLFRKFKGVKLDKFFQRGTKCFSFILCSNIDEAVSIIEEMDQIIVGGRWLKVKAANNELQEYIDILLEERKKTKSDTASEFASREEKKNGTFNPKLDSDFHRNRRILNDSARASFGSKSALNKSEGDANDSSLISLRVMKNGSAGRKRFDSQKDSHLSNYNKEIQQDLPSLNDTKESQQDSLPLNCIKESQQDSLTSNYSKKILQDSSSLENQQDTWPLNYSKESQQDSPPLNYDKESQQNFSSLDYDKESRDCLSANGGKKSQEDSHSLNYCKESQQDSNHQNYHFLNYSEEHQQDSHSLNYIKRRHQDFRPLNDIKKNHNSSYTQCDYKIDKFSQENPSFELNKFRESASSPEKWKNNSSTKSKHHNIDRYQNIHHDSYSQQYVNSYDSCSNRQEDMYKPRPDITFLDQYGEDADKLFWVSVTNFPLGTSIHALRQLFYDFSPMYIHMVCNMPNIDKTLTEAIIGFCSQAFVDDVILNFDNTIYRGRLLLVNDLENLTAMEELLVVNNKS